MATTEEIALWRGLVPDSELTDEQIGALIDDSECMNIAVAAGWANKAAGYSVLVDISEAGSSRSQSQLFGNANKMAAYYTGLGCGDAVDPVTTGTTQTRQIERL